MLANRLGAAMWERVRSMTSRDFTDEHGELWHVRAIRPESLDRRVADDPMLTVPTRTGIKVQDPAMMNGWLAFESPTQRRKLAPIPAGWHKMDERELRTLLSQAIVATAFPRLLKKDRPD